MRVSQARGGGKRPQKIEEAGPRLHGRNGGETSMPKCINTSLVPRRDLSLSVMASLPLSSLVLFPLLGISFLVFFAGCLISCRASSCLSG